MIALCLVVITILSVAGSILLAYKSNVAEQRRVQAENQRSRAEQHRRSRQAIDTLLTQSAAELQKSPGTSELQLALLDNAVRFYEQFPADITARRDIRYETSLVYIRVARMCLAISTAEYRNKALELLNRAIGVLEALATEDPAKADYRLASIRARIELARLRRLMADEGSAYKVSDPSLTQRAVELARALFDSDSSSEVYRDTLAAALEEHYRYSIFDQSAGSHRTPTPELLAQLSEARDLLVGLVEEFPDKKDYESRLADVGAIHDQALLPSVSLPKPKSFTRNRSMLREHSCRFLRTL